MGDLVPLNKRYLNKWLYFPLQVWYAASYADFVNQKIHDVTEEERKGDSLHLLNIIITTVHNRRQSLSLGFSWSSPFVVLFSAPGAREELALL